MAKDSFVDPAARDKYLLQVTAGPSYDPATHEEVCVNGDQSTYVESELVSCWLRVRIKDYHGLPHGAPATSPYFDHKLHTSDRYSIAFSFVPKDDLPGKDIVMGFDYDHSIKHQLPPGFKYAMKIATTMLDPGIYSDPYSDNPYLYGPALSGLFSLNIGDRIEDVAAKDQLAQFESQNSGVVEEGAIGSGQPIRDELGLPTKWKKRRKHFLTVSNLEKFTFEKGRMYHTDFFNPYLDFANFALRLPGFSISIARYIDEKTHHLRFVVKNRETGTPLFVVFFKLLFGKELEEMLESRKDKGEGQMAQASEETKQDGDGMHGNISSDDEGSMPRSSTSSVPVINEERRQRAQSQASQASDSSADEGKIGQPTTMVTSLASSIYSAFAAMTFRDQSSSTSSEDDSRRKANTPAASHRSLEARVDDMDDKTVEKYLKAQTSSA